MDYSNSKKDWTRPLEFILWSSHGGQIMLRSASNTDLVQASILSYIIPKAISRKCPACGSTTVIPLFNMAVRWKFEEIQLYLGSHQDLVRWTFLRGPRAWCVSLVSWLVVYLPSPPPKKKTWDFLELIKRGRGVNIFGGIFRWRGKESFRSMALGVPEVRLWGRSEPRFPGNKWKVLVCWICSGISKMHALKSKCC